MSPETTDEEKSGKIVSLQSHGSAQQAERERRQPEARTGTTRQRRPSWSWEAASLPSSSVVSGDIRGTSPIPRGRHRGGRRCADLPLVCRPAKLTVLRVGDCRSPVGGMEFRERELPDR